MPVDDIVDSALLTADLWFESHRKKNGSVTTNVMTSGLAVAELLRTSFPLTEDTIKSQKNSQVKGLSGPRIKEILARYGETRKFTSEGGRTSRGTLVIASELADKLTSALSPYRPDEEERVRVADALQGFFVEKVKKDYFDKKTIEVALDYNKPVSAVVADILDASKRRSDQPTGIVAQHLVGAKLEMRFPGLEVGRDKANAADLQTGRQGDFQLGNTAFHVTVAPSAKLAERVRANVSDGYRSVVLVPSAKVDFASELFRSEGLGDQVGVQSIESFVGTNIEEMSGFDTSGIRLGIAKLVRTYNKRIVDCEVDQSLRIDEPEWFELRIVRLDAR